MNRAVPELLDYIVAKMLAKPLEERYQDAAELARDLRECERQLAAADRDHPVGGGLSRRISRGGAATDAGRYGDARSSVLAQTLSRTREADRVRRRRRRRRRAALQLVRFDRSDAAPARRSPARPHAGAADGHAGDQVDPRSRPQPLAPARLAGGGGGHGLRAARRARSCVRRR